LYRVLYLCFFFSSRRRHTRSKRDWSSDVCSSDLDCIFAVSFTIRERGIAAEFSNDTKKLSILQADSEYAFQQKDLEAFLGKYGVNTAINLSKVNSQSGVELYSNKVNYFDTEEDGNFGVWLREDQYDSWKKT